MEWNNQEQPWYKRLWFIVVAITVTLLVLIGIIIGVVLLLTKDNDQNNNSKWLEFPKEDEIENVVFYETETFDLANLNFKNEEEKGTYIGEAELLLYAAFDGENLKVEFTAKAENIEMKMESTEDISTMEYDRIAIDNVFLVDVNDTTRYIHEMTNYSEGFIFTIEADSMFGTQSADKTLGQNIQLGDDNYVYLYTVENASSVPPIEMGPEINVDEYYSIRGDINGTNIEEITGEEFLIDEIDRSLSEVF